MTATSASVGIGEMLMAVLENQPPARNADLDGWMGQMRAIQRAQFAMDELQRRRSTMKLSDESADLCQEIADAAFVLACAWAEYSSFVASERAAGREVGP